MSSQSSSGEAGPPPQTSQRTFLDDVILTFSSPMAWLLVIALIITWSGVAIVLFDLLDYKTLAVSQLPQSHHVPGPELSHRVRIVQPHTSNTLIFNSSPHSPPSFTSSPSSRRQSPAISSKEYTSYCDDPVCLSPGLPPPSAAIKRGLRPRVGGVRPTKSIPAAVPADVTAPESADWLEMIWTFVASLVAPDEEEEGIHQLTETLTSFVSEEL